MESILIKNGYIFTLDNKNRIFESDGSIYIKSHKIEYIGKTDELPVEYTNDADVTIDASNRLVLPGLINSHIHAASTLYRGVGDDMTLMEENKRVMFPIEREMTTDDSYWGTLLACVELIKSGTTCMADHYIKMDGSAEAVKKIGMRAVLATAMMDQWDQHERAPIRSTEECLKENENLVKNWHGKENGRIRCRFGPYTELLASGELLKRSRELADKYGVGIQIHLAETYDCVERIKRDHGGKRVFEYMNDLGVLGPDVMAAHCVWLSPREIGIIKGTGVKPIHMPVAEMKLSDGISPVPALLREGVPVALGTDGGGWNNCNDMIREMKQVALLHKVNLPLDPTQIPSERALQMATINGANALGMETEIGSLEKGKKADIILINLKKPHWTPLLLKPKLNLINHLVYSGVGSDVDTVIIDGRIIMRNRVLQTISEEKVLEGAQRAAENLIERSGVCEEDMSWRWKEEIGSYSPKKWKAEKTLGWPNPNQKELIEFFK